MPAYWVARSKIHDPTQYKRYTDLVPAIIARHQGLKVVGISCITNFAAGMTEGEIDHNHVMETGEQVADIFRELLRRIVDRLGP